MSKKKKKSHKSKQKAWGLEFKVFNSGIRNYLDIDYVDKLNDKEKDFLDKFIQTYYNNVYPPYTKPEETNNIFDKANIPRKDTFDRTNARNRDIYTKRYKLDTTAFDFCHENQRNSEERRNTVEGANVEYIDFKRLLEKYIKAGLSEDKARIKALKAMEDAENQK